MNRLLETEEREMAEASFLPRKVFRKAPVRRAREERSPHGGAEDPAGIRERASTRIMYIECKAEALNGDARIGRVRFSRTGGTLYYREQCFKSLKGAGYKSNYFDVATGDRYWISGPRRDGADRLYGERLPVEIDEDVREEYWREIRRRP